MKRVAVKKNDKQRELILGVSTRTGYNWHYAKGSEGLHFKSLSSAKTYFERKYKGSEIEIV